MTESGFKPSSGVPAVATMLGCLLPAFVVDFNRFLSQRNPESMEPVTHRGAWKVVERPRFHILEGQVGVLMALLIGSEPGSLQPPEFLPLGLHQSGTGAVAGVK